MFLKNPVLEWKSFPLRSSESTVVTAMAAVVCDTHCADADLNEAQEATARLITPHVGMRFRLRFFGADGVQAYESEVYYKRLGVSLLEAASTVLDRNFPKGTWPADLTSDRTEVEYHGED